VLVLPLPAPVAEAGPLEWGRQEATADSERRAALGILPSECWAVCLASGSAALEAVALESSELLSGWLASRALASELGLAGLAQAAEEWLTLVVQPQAQPGAAADEPVGAVQEELESLRHLARWEPCRYRGRARSLDSDAELAEVMAQPVAPASEAAIPGVACQDTAVQLCRTEPLRFRRRLLSLD